MARAWSGCWRSVAAAKAGAGVMDQLGHDPLVSSLLVLYSIHPESFEVRVQRGLETMRPSLRKRDVRIDGLEISGETVRIRLAEPATDDLKAAVREALYETAPDATEVEIEGGGGPAAAGFVPLASLIASASNPNRRGYELFRDVAEHGSQATGAGALRVVRKRGWACAFAPGGPGHAAAGVRLRCVLAFVFAARRNQV